MEVTASKPRASRRNALRSTGPRAFHPATEMIIHCERLPEREVFRAMRQPERLQGSRRGEAVPPPIGIGA